MEITNEQKQRALKIIDELKKAKEIQLKNDEMYALNKGMKEKPYPSNFIIVSDNNGVKKEYSLVKMEDLNKLEDDMNKGIIKLNDLSELNKAKEKAMIDMGLKKTSGIDNSSKIDISEKTNIANKDISNDIDEVDFEKKLNKAYNDTGIELLDSEGKDINTNKESKKISEKITKEVVSDIKNTTKESKNVIPKIKEAMNLIKKIPGGSKILSAAKIAKNVARNPITGVIIGLSEGLADTRFEELSDENRSLASKAIGLINEVGQKSIINSTSGIVDFAGQAGAWSVGNLVDGYNNLFKTPKELKEIGDVSDDAIDQWNNTMGKWIRNAQSIGLSGVDKRMYGDEKAKETLKEYRDEVGLDENGENKIEMKEDSKYSNENKKKDIGEKLNKNKTSNDLVNFQDRQIIFDPKTNTYGYISKQKGIEGQEKIGFKSIDDLKKDISTGVKGFHIDEIKKGIAGSKTTDDVRNYINNYNKKVDLKSKGIQVKEDPNNGIIIL